MNGGGWKKPFFHRGDRDRYYFMEIRSGKDYIVSIFLKRIKD